ncbi:unnamed protein product [Vicia faba]|uniref:Uncharacterized protein n=1 Tax=Vicia faba TaxID=3906 RepID=A0AAV1BB92_VICFA|nr:unnamed protein product [Vicia faba]
MEETTESAKPRRQPWRYAYRRSTIGYKFMIPTLKSLLDLVSNATPDNIETKSRKKVRIGNGLRVAYPIVDDEKEECRQKEKVDHQLIMGNFQLNKSSNRDCRTQREFTSQEEFNYKKLQEESYHLEHHFLFRSYLPQEKCSYSRVDSEAKA